MKSSPKIADSSKTPHKYHGPGRFRPGADPRVCSLINHGSGSPLDAADVAINVANACNLAKRGHSVVLFLVQNGVLPVRRGANAETIAAAIDAGVTVLADDFSLRERGIGSDELATGISASPLESVVDFLASGAKTVWH